MILSVEKNVILIDTSECSIKRYQISQLRFYGYEYSENIYHKTSIELESDLLKIISYLKQENIEFETTSAVDALLSYANRRKSEQEELFKLAEKIKNGKIDNKLFRDFKRFLDRLPRKLLLHQLKAAYHLYSLKNGANFSVPGSGKTSVILSVYEKLRLEGKCNVLFVVGPPSCFQPWQNEFHETLGRSPEVVILSGGDKHIRKTEYYGSKYTLSELYLTTFQTIMNDYHDVVKFLGQKGVHAFFVVDEAHYMKQIGGSWATTLLGIAEHTEFRCVLTGTPIPKSYTDLFNLFDFLWPKESPLNEEDKIQIQLWEKEKNNEAAKSLLEKRVGPLFYRVRKKDLGLKPAIFHDPTIIKMNSYEYRIHELIKSKIFELSKEEFLENEEILYNLWKGRMIRLRQSVSYPKLLFKSIEKYKEDLLVGDSELVETIQNYDNLEIPGKLDFLTRKVMELNRQGQKVLIWSNFIGTLELINSHLSKLGLRSELIYGKTPVKKRTSKEVSDELTREEIRDIFVNSESGLDILIANPAACSESISLHKTCFHAIYYDLSYNCAQYLQSLDRIHRVGGSEINSANYYFLQYESSIDQDIKTNLEFKAQKMYAIVEQDYEIYHLDMFEETAENDIAAYKRLFHQK